MPSDCGERAVPVVLTMGVMGGGLRSTLTSSFSWAHSPLRQYRTWQAGTARASPCFGLAL
eukprot:3182604-Rhodomonas_salina.2